MGGEAVPPSARTARRRWAILIKRVYNADPLLCPKCGGTMRIISFIEARQQDVIRKILHHCGLWQEPPPRAPPGPARSSQPDGQGDASRPGVTYEVDPDFLEHTRREQFVQPELPW